MTVLFGSTANNYLVLDWASVTVAYFFGVRFDRFHQAVPTKMGSKFKKVHLRLIEKYVLTCFIACHQSKYCKGWIMQNILVKFDFNSSWLLLVTCDRWLLSLHRNKFFLSDTKSRIFSLIAKSTKKLSCPLRISSVNVNFVIFTEEILNGKLHFLSSELKLMRVFSDYASQAYPSSVLKRDCGERLNELGRGT